MLNYPYDYISLVMCKTKIVASKFSMFKVGQFYTQVILLSTFRGEFFVLFSYRQSVEIQSLHKANTIIGDCLQTDIQWKEKLDCKKKINVHFYQVSRK